MQDLISRQDAIDAVCLNNYHDITLVNGKPYTRGYRDGVLAKENDCIENIMNLPSAQPEPQWIPVDKKSHPDTPERVQVQLDNGWIITAYYEENEWLSVPYCDEPIEDRWIEAWMPLPEPYRAERRTDG